MDAQPPRVTHAFVLNKHIGETEPTTRCGIYYIYNVRTHKSYVGSSVNILARIKVHFRDLLANRHHCDHLQKSFNKHGVDGFTWGVCEEVESTDDLLSYEQMWMDQLGHYNTYPTAGSSRGAKLVLSEEEREKRRSRAREIRKHMSEEEIAELHARVGAAKKGVALSEEHKRKLSEATKGRGFTEEHLASLRCAMQSRQPMSIEVVEARTRAFKKTMATKTSEEIDEWKRKLSEKAKGRVSPMRGKSMSQEARAKISAARKGKKLSEEHKAMIRIGVNGLSCEKKAEMAAKISAAHKGVPKSPEHLAAIAAAKAAAKAARK